MKRGREGESDGVDLVVAPSFLSLGSSFSWCSCSGGPARAGAAGPGFS
jgi:hypothetical protein